MAPVESVSPPRKMTLSKWCRFDKPGTYTVTGKRTLNLSREEGLSIGRGDGPLDKPISDSFTITVLEPTPEQARDKVEQMMENRRGANFGVLNHPVYLPILLEYARQGDLDAVGGIGGILTPEATRSLIELAEQWLDDGKLVAGLCEWDIDGRGRDAEPDVGADEIALPAIFSDGFERGDTSPWSSAYP